MQCAVIDVARHLAKMPKAHSTEFASQNPVPRGGSDVGAEKNHPMGGSMRLGVYPCRLKAGSLAHKAYGRDLVHERHRHRYELNNKYRKALEKAGLRVVGEYPRLHLAEVVELKNHPWYVAVQYHPELKSRPLHPHPLFRDLHRRGASTAFSSARGCRGVTPMGLADCRWVSLAWCGSCLLCIRASLVFFARRGGIFAEKGGDTWNGVGRSDGGRPDRPDPRRS
jgi:hypothetical protein